MDRRSYRGVLGRWSAEWRARHQYFIRSALTPDHDAQGHYHDTKVDPPRGVSHVPLIQCVFFAWGEQCSSVHLRPTGDAGADRQAHAWICRLVTRQKWARSDQRHVSHEHVDQLRELVEAGASQEPAHPRFPFVFRNRLAQLIEGWPQRAKLVDHKGPSPCPQTLLPEHDWPTDIDERKPAGEEQEWRAENKDNCGGDEIDGIFPFEVRGHYRGCHDTSGRLLDTRCKPIVECGQTNKLGDEVERNFTLGADALDLPQRLLRQQILVAANHDPVGVHAMLGEFVNDRL